MELLNSYDSSYNLCQLQDAKQNILYYIADYVVKKIDLDCFSCTNSLYKKPNEHDYCKESYSKFVNLKNRSGLISASKSVFLIILNAEKLFLHLTDNLKFFMFYN